MANLNQGADPAALPVVPCPDCGRNVVAYVAHCGQSAGERFYKCRNHNVVDAISTSGSKRTPTTSRCLVQSHPRWRKSSQDKSKATKLWELKIQVSHAPQGSRTALSEGTQFISSVSKAAGYMLAALSAAGRQGTIGADTASINLVVSVANFVIGVAILLLVVADMVMHVLG